MTARDEHEILHELRRMLAEVLGLDPEVVTPEARIMDDLAAESIDLLDLRFRLERSFGVRMTSQDFTLAADNPPSVEEFHRRFTVDALCSYVRRRMDSPDE